MTSTSADPSLLNIVVPMAGRGSRFQNVGYVQPKPLIPVAGRPMVQLVIDNLRPRRPHRFIFIVLAEMQARYGLDQQLARWAPGCEIRTVSQVTEGPACTVLLTRDLIDSHDPLMIANCDQWVDVDINDYLAVIDRRGVDCLVMTMWADHPKWSYVRHDERGRPCELVEKQVVSEDATVGIYNFRRGADFVAAADEMIAKDFRVNGEFYVAPAYNQLLDKGATLELYNVGKVLDGMYGLGTPEDLEAFRATAAYEALAGGQK